MSLLERLLSGFRRYGGPEETSGQSTTNGSASVHERLLASLDVAVHSLAICEVASGNDSCWPA